MTSNPGFPTWKRHIAFTQEALHNTIQALVNRNTVRGGGSAAARSENAAINYILAAFAQMADHYIDGAVQLIDKTAKISDRERLFLAESALQNLTNHLNTLVNLARPNLSAAADTATLFRQVLAVAATRFRSGEQDYYPILAPDYQFVNLTYLRPIDVIGIPAIDVATASWTWSILWHEVAGSQMERLIQRGILDNLAANSSLKSLGAGVEFALPFGPDDLDKIRFTKKQLENLAKYDELAEAGYLKPSIEVAAWLRQFGEDFNGAYAMGAAFAEILAEVLSRHYAGPRVVDPNHPSPRLRVLAVLEFARLLQAEISNSGPVQAAEWWKLFDVSSAKERIRERFPELIENPTLSEKKQVEEVAGLFRLRNVLQHYPALCQEVSPVEQKVAVTIINAYRKSVGCNSKDDIAQINHDFRAELTSLFATQSMPHVILDSFDPTKDPDYQRSLDQIDAYVAKNDLAGLLNHKLEIVDRNAGTTNPKPYRPPPPEINTL